jgi:hypothetical protein
MQTAARNAGLDALLYVVEDPAEAPDPESLDALDPQGPRVFLAAAISGPGYRFACVVPRGRDLDLEPIEAQGDPALIQATLRAVGGIALPVCPRQSDHGAVVREAPRPSGERTGVVALVVPGSRLGRDLDLEDAAVAERPILGASGPFASVSEIGRYATLLPLAIGASDEAGLIAALALGHGIAVEQGPRRRVTSAPPDPAEGREHEEGPRKKRRRRRRSKSSDGA